MSEQGKHPYPSRHQPGSHWSTDEAWAILDRLPVGMLPDDHRFLIGGCIAGALLRVASSNTLRNEALLQTATAAYHALQSYAHSNASQELAREIADALKTALTAADVRLLP